MPRRTKLTTSVIAALALAVLTMNSAARAADAPPATDQTQAQPTEQRPLSPPPGISIIPSAPMRPPQANGQVPGCPAQNLKPLELLV